MDFTKKKCRKVNLQRAIFAHFIELFSPFCHFCQEINDQRADDVGDKISPKKTLPQNEMTQCGGAQADEPVPSDHLLEFNGERED